MQVHAATLTLSPISINGNNIGRRKAGHSKCCFPVIRAAGIDGHPAHRATATKEFAASTGGRLRLIFLPGYSPELNPDEWAWKNVKHDRIGKTGVTSKQDLKAKAIGALRRLQKRPGLVRAFFADPHLHYITA